MKKMVKMTGIALLVSIVFMGCATTNGLKENPNNEILGYWRTEPKYKMFNHILYFVFNKDNKCITVGTEQEFTGQYSVKGDQVIVKTDNDLITFDFKDKTLLYRPNHDETITLKKANVGKILQPNNNPQGRVILAFLKSIKDSNIESYQNLLSSKVKEELLSNKIKETSENFYSIKRQIKNIENSERLSFWNEMKKELDGNLAKLNLILEDEPNKGNVIIKWDRQFFGEIEVVKEGENWKINDINICYYENCSGDSTGDCTG